MNNDEIKDQRIGHLRSTLEAVRDGVALISQDLAALIDQALKDDERIAGNGPQPAGEQLKELAESHRGAALSALCRLFEEALPNISASTIREYGADVISNVVAAAGYEAEARARLR